MHGVKNGTAPVPRTAQHPDIPSWAVRLVRYLGRQPWRRGFIAPSRLCPSPAEQRAKIDRRDALLLARELQAGNLTRMVVPDEGGGGLVVLILLVGLYSHLLRCIRTKTSEFAMTARLVLISVILQIPD